MNSGDVSDKADEIGRRADDSDLLDHAVRVGLIAYGIVHLLIAWVAVSLAFGSDEGSASSSGALNQLAQTPFGHITLYVVAAGFAALVLWQLIEAAVGHRDENGGARVLQRVGSAFKAVLYGYLGFSALKIALGGGSGGGTDSTTSKLMTTPGGQILVGLVGLGILVARPRKVRRSRPGTSQGATTAIRGTHPGGDGTRHRLLWPVLLRTGATP